MKKTKTNLLNTRNKAKVHVDFWLRTVTAIAVLILAGCAAGERHFDEGQRLSAQGDQDNALRELNTALQLEPNNANYRLAVRAQTQKIVDGFVKAGDQQRDAGQFDAALASYQSANRVNPQNEFVLRKIAGLVSMQSAQKLTIEADRLLSARKIAEANTKVNTARAEDAQYPPAVALKRRIDGALADEERAKEVTAAEQSVMKKPITLQIRDANLRMVFESLSRIVGLNVILDRDVRTDLKTTIFVKDATVSDTIDLILLQNQLEKRVINGSTLFIYPGTVAKQKEYQELKIKVFELSNVDAKYVQSLLKTLVKIKDIVIDEKNNTVAIRDTAEAIAVAESLVAAHDIPDAEVMLEVEVLEVSRDRLSNIGVRWPDGISFSVPPGAAASGALTLGEFRNLKSGQLLVNPPLLSLGINAQLLDSDANLLASPRIRVRHREKAKILIGDRVPFVSGSNTIAAGANPIISSTVQYLDVGIKLEVEPNVYAENEVGIKINMEVSNIAKQIVNKNTGDILYQIGTRSASTSLRLKDGETQVLAGLLSDQERSSVAKVPGLGQTPVIGRLFSDANTNATKTEIVLSITPRIIRGRLSQASAGKEIWSGTDARVSNVPLRLESGTMRSESGAGSSANSAARALPHQSIPGAVIPGSLPPPPSAPTVRPSSSVSGAVPGVTAEQSMTAPAGIAEPIQEPAPVPAPTQSPRVPAQSGAGLPASEGQTQDFFSPQPPGYSPLPILAPGARTPGAGLGDQRF